MSPNKICPLPKEPDTLSEMFRKTSEGLDYTKQALVTTTDTVVKEANTHMVDKEGNQSSYFIKKEN